MTIVDDLVSVDDLIEEHLTAEPVNEYVQSCDIVAFNKICKFDKICTPFYAITVCSVIGFYLHPPDWTIFYHLMVLILDAEFLRVCESLEWMLERFLELC